MVASSGGGWLYWGCRTGCPPVGLRPAGANVAVSLFCSRYQRSKSHSLYRRVQISLMEGLSLWQINLYELFLWLKGSRLGNWVIALLSWMHHSTY